MSAAGGFVQGGLVHENSQHKWRIAATVMVCIYTFIFGYTWHTVPRLYPAEIFSLNVRADAWESLAGIWALYPESSQRTLEDRPHIRCQISFFGQLTQIPKGPLRETQSLELLAMQYLSIIDSLLGFLSVTPRQSQHIHVNLGKLKPFVLILCMIIRAQEPYHC